MFFAHSGGVTAVVNTIALAVIKEAAANNDKIDKVFAGKNGILGALNEELIDLSQEEPNEIAKLHHTPASAFGSCRFKLSKDTEYEQIIKVFKAHNIKYFLYNGGNDSQDTTYKIWQAAIKLQYPLQCIGIPKTVDNDLAITDNCPGFGSVAKYIAISTREASYDVISMANTSTKVFILEVMGRHAGWITAAAGLASTTAQDGPHILLFPEIRFNQEVFLQEVNKCVSIYGHCVIVASEGIKDAADNFVSAASNKDAFGHAQLGGVAPILANIVTTHTSFKTHWAVADYLQRSARHIASACDVAQAAALGKEAVTAAITGKSGIMTAIKRESNVPYKWSVTTADLADVANVEKKLPADYIRKDGLHITEKCRQYIQPLIQGEDYPPYDQTGLPCYAKLKNNLTDKKIHDK